MNAQRVVVLLFAAAALAGCPGNNNNGGTWHDRIFVATSYSADTEPVYEVTGGTTKQFAMVKASGWLGPLIITKSGKFYAITNDQGGSVFDITAGGDLTGATALVTGIFANNIDYIDGAAADSNGNLYIANSEHGPQALAKVDMSTKQVTTFGNYDNAEGVLIVGNFLYISEGGAGRVIKRDLSSGTETTFASGFETGQSHISGQLAVDPSGHIWVNWHGQNANAAGLYDITNGGDFSAVEPAAEQTFDRDVNQVAFTSAGDAYVAGADSDACYVAKKSGASLQALQSFATGLSDNETIVVGP